MKFERAVTWPIGGEDFVIDVILLKRVHRNLRGKGIPLDLADIETVLLAAEDAVNTTPERRLG